MGGDENCRTELRKRPQNENGKRTQKRDQFLYHLFVFSIRVPFSDTVFGARKRHRFWSDFRPR